MYGEGGEGCVGLNWGFVAEGGGGLRAEDIYCIRAVEEVLSFNRWVRVRNGF